MEISIWKLRKLRCQYARDMDKAKIAELELQVISLQTELESSKSQVKSLASLKQRVGKQVVDRTACKKKDNKNSPEKLREQVCKYSRMLPTILENNCRQVQSIIDSIDALMSSAKTRAEQYVVAQQFAKEELKRMQTMRDTVGPCTPTKRRRCRACHADLARGVDNPSRTLCRGCYIQRHPIVKVQAATSSASSTGGNEAFQVSSTIHGARESYASPATQDVRGQACPKWRRMIKEDMQHGLLVRFSANSEPNLRGAQAILHDSRPRPWTERGFPQDYTAIYKTRDGFHEVRLFGFDYMDLETQGEVCQRYVEE